jgi:hypothetical protein
MMATGVRGLAVCAVALALAPLAGATEATIIPGVGIGKVKRGMTQSQVKKALGNWRYVNERKGSHLSVGWGFAEWTIDFIGGRTVQVATSVHSQRTTSGIGTGSSWLALVRAYPKGVCTFLGGDRRGNPVEYLVPHKGGTQTIYVLPYPKAPLGSVALPPWRVTEVLVRTPFERLPEFAPSWQLECKADWRTSDSPI